MCQFVSKRGVKCQDKKLAGSNWCHRKTHYPDSTTYKNVVSNLREQWKKTTFSTALFDMHIVPEDGWCFFYSFGYSILKMMRDSLAKYPPNERERVRKMSDDPIFRFFNRERFRAFFEGKISEIRFRKEMARALQTLGSEWILSHLDSKHELTGERVEDLLLASHELDSVEEYKEEILNLPAITESKVLGHSNWGSVCEQYALAKYFGVNVIVLCPVGFSKQGKTFRSRLARVVRRNVTRFSPMNHCISLNSEGESELKSYLHMIEGDLSGDVISVFWQTLPDNLRDNILEELRRTVYLVWFSQEDEDGDDVSHYNYLLMSQDLLPKK